MPQADASSFTRVAVVAPRSRVDVALPTDVPVVDLLPGLLEMVGERSPDGGSAHDGWRLTGVDGRPLDTARTLGALDVLDGSTVRLAPSRELVAPPVHDDVVEAIADAVRGRADERSLRTQGRAVAVAALLVTAATLLLLGGTGLVGALVAAGTAIVALVVGRALAVGAPRPVGLALAVASVAPAFAAGWLAVPGGGDTARLLLGSAAALAVAVVAALVLPGAVTAVAAAVTVGAFATVGALVGVLVGAAPGAIAVACSALAVGALSVVPWFAVRLARLPMPTLPTGGDDLRTPVPAADDVADRARVGAATVDGATIGCALTAGAGAVAAARVGTPLAVVYAVVVLAVLLLRTRSVASRPPRLALLLVPLAAGAACLAGAATRVGPVAAVSLAVACALVTVLVAVAALVPTRGQGMPVAARALDLVELLGLTALLPLAVGALDLYSYVRHL